MPKEEKKRVLKGVCKDCKVRKNDKTVKKLFRCVYCKEYFCKKHVEPKLFFLKSALEKAERFEETDVVNKIYEDWRKEDGHACYPYTIRFFENVEIRRKKYIETLNKLLYKKEKFEVLTPDKTQSSRIEESESVEKMEKKYDKTTRFFDKISKRDVTLIVVMIFILLFFILLFIFSFQNKMNLENLKNYNISIEEFIKNLKINNTSK